MESKFTEFKKTMQKYVNCSYEELLFLAKNGIKELENEMLAKCRSKEDVIRTYIIMAVACIGADRKLTVLECAFLGDLLGINPDPDKIMEIANYWGIEETMNGLDSIADSLSDEGKMNLIKICSAFLAVDESISIPEIDFILKLIK